MFNFKFICVFCFSFKLISIKISLSIGLFGCLFTPQKKNSHSTPTLSCFVSRPFVLLKICKEFQKNLCKKEASECAHAHPPSHCPVDQENSLVTVCVDFIKGKCARETCKYFHPPEHLVAQLKKQKLTNNAIAAAAFAAAATASPANNFQLLSAYSPAPLHHHQLHSYNQYGIQYATSPSYFQQRQIGNTQIIKLNSINNSLK